ncbi:MAG: type II toxin-antitoxin system death-on-curing family toxin [Lentisphaeria bacterium]|nr:type II toxin-antitoxin system death-on-curing family toxin [Lentisphaeria bacterium]
MTGEPHFITLEEALFFHKEEIRQAGGSEGIRDPESLEAALSAPKVAFGNAFLMGDIFEMAAAYVESVCARHPFVDGNKRTGTVCALTFLLLNGYEIDEMYDLELADIVLDLVTHKIDRQGLADFSRTRAKPAD